MVTGGEDGTARLWNVSTGALERVLQEQPPPVTAVAFSGRDVFVSWKNGTVKVYRIRMGQM